MPFHLFHNSIVFTLASEFTFFKMNVPNWLAWRVSCFLFHATVSIVYVYCLVFDELTREERFKINSAKGEPAFAGDWKFLTRWNFVSELFCRNFSCCLRKLVVHELFPQKQFIF